MTIQEEPKAFGLQSVMIGRKPENGGNGLGVKEEEAPTLTKADRHAVCYDTTQVTSPQNGSNPQEGDPCHPISKTAHAPLLVENQSFLQNQVCEVFTSDVMHTLNTNSNATGRNAPNVLQGNDRTAETLVKSNNQWMGLRTDIAQQNAVMVRRLTPMECEKLQGFPPGYTDIPVYEIRKGVKKYKPAPDSARYAALGNSMTTNVMHWLGSRIQAVQDTLDFADLL